jgi:hypothetical protein
MESYTSLLNFRVTSEERQAIRNAADAAGLTVSEWLRTIALEGLVTSALSDLDPCADGFCPVSLFPPIDDTEGSA